MFRNFFIVLLTMFAFNPKIKSGMNTLLKKTSDSNNNLITQHSINILFFWERNFDYNPLYENIFLKLGITYQKIISDSDYNIFGMIGTKIVVKDVNLSFLILLNHNESALLLQIIPDYKILTVNMGFTIILSQKKILLGISISKKVHDFTLELRLGPSWKTI